MNLIRFILIFGIISLSTGLIGEKLAYGINEDQVIVCINGNVIELSGDICKVFYADNDHNRTIQDIQEELYKNPDSDTFNMEVID